MKWEEERAYQEQKWKQPANKKDFWSGKNISGICSETPEITDKPIQKCSGNGKLFHV